MKILKKEKLIEEKMKKTRRTIKRNKEKKLPRN